MIGSIIGAGIMSAGSLYGQYLQTKAQQKINEQNLAYQDEANKLSIDLANTAHQREIADLRAAGLNPILSAGGSGAQTPSIGAITAENPYHGVANTASSLSREVGRLFTDQVQLANEQTSAQTENIRAQKKAIESDAELKLAMADTIRLGRKFVDKTKAVLTPAAESLGGIFGNSAFETAQSLKEQFEKGKDTHRRVFYKGRYVDPYWLMESDPDYFRSWLKKNDYKTN